MRVLDLFSGIGGFALGMERAGHDVVAFCEIDDFCVQVLEKHWPNIPVYRDIRKLYRFADEYEPCDYCGEPFCLMCNEHFWECTCIGCSQFDDDVGLIQIITAGFPCQDISLLNSIHKDNVGIDGEQSRLWREALRIICSLRPEWVVLENVAALTIRGLGRILAELASSGYDTEWHSIPVAAVGGEHLRKRTWIIAHDSSLGIQKLWPKGVKQSQELGKEALSVRHRNGEWKIEPDFLRSVYGVSKRLDKSRRIKAIGNSIAPQISELIGVAIKNQSRLVYESGGNE